MTNKEFAHKMLNHLVLAPNYKHSMALKALSAFPDFYTHLVKEEGKRPKTYIEGAAKTPYNMHEGKLLKMQGKKITSRTTWVNKKIELWEQRKVVSWQKQGRLTPDGVLRLRSDYVA